MCIPTFNLNLARNCLISSINLSLNTYRVSSMVGDSLGIFKESFDNTVTPYYALVICLWGK